MVDLSDYAAWVGCLAGPGVAPVAGCGWGDLDGDGDVDVGDFAVFVASFGGGVSAECGVFDFEPDGDVDLADFGSFCVSFTGSGSPLPADCVRFDREPDGDVDLSDFAVFAACCTGAGSAAPANPYYFTGRRLDFDIRDDGAGQTGRPGRPLLTLYDYRAREYDPWHGRFTSRDPAEYAESLNLYQYVLSNPQAHTDPTGQFSYGSVLSAIGTGARVYGWYTTGMTIRRAIEDFAAGVSFRNVMLDLVIGFAVDKAAGKTLDLLVDVAGPVLRKVGRKVVASVRGGRAPVDIGKAGEIAAGIPAGPKTRIPSLSGKAQFRIPDELSEGEFLKEIKNVADRLGYAGQIEDFFLYAQKMDIEFT